VNTQGKTLKPATINRALMKAASNWIRVQVYSIVAERVASAKELAEQLGIQDVSNVRYHLNVLKELGLVEVAKTRRRGGAIENFYRSVERPLVSEEEWKEFSPKERENFTKLAVQLINIDVARSMSNGAFDRRDDRHLTRTPFQVDQEGWRELVQIHLDAFYRSLEVQARSDERRSRSSERAVLVYSAQMLFEGGFEPSEK